MARPLPETELQEALDWVRDWSALRGARIFVTGGTGFFGKWLLELLGAAQHCFGLGAEVVVLSRDPERFLDSMPHLRRAKWLSFQQGEITSFRIPDGPFSHLIHGAGSSDARDYANNPAEMMRSLVEGSVRVMDAMSKKTLLRVLFLSSGAVYGPQPEYLYGIPDDFPVLDDLAAHTPTQIYAQGKREAERVVASSCHTLGFSYSIGRGFAFAGPHLPLDRHFAFGNFIRDALEGGPIYVRGDGTPIRSYLYSSELAACLWALLLCGENTTYNIGNDQAISIRELAETVGRAASVPVLVATPSLPGRQPPRYVPEISRIKMLMEFSPKISIEESVRRSLRWYRG